MSKAYVVSQDIKLLLEKWAQDKVLYLPNDRFFYTLRKDFENYMKKIFSNFQFVYEYELIDGINHLINSEHLPIISIDRVYCKSLLNLDLTRSVDKDGNEVGLENRPYTLSVEKQIEEIARLGIQEMALVDDVIYSGSLMVNVIKLLKAKGIDVQHIYAGIGIKVGIDHIRNSGYKRIKCVKYFDEVLDEICERDFYPGIPLSGRLLSDSQNIGLPYILPFGNPEKWASIPPSETHAFSRFCIKQSIKLFKQIEKCSNREIMSYELGRRVLNCDQGRFVDQLKHHL